jgi:hypothetical protein
MRKKGATILLLIRVLFYWKVVHTHQSSLPADFEPRTRRMFFLVWELELSVFVAAVAVLVCRSSRGPVLREPNTSA